MRAGNLREHIYFKELQKTQQSSGAVKENWYIVYSCRAELLKTTPIYDKDSVNAKEIFQGTTKYFRVRRNKIIKEEQRVVWDGREFDIISIDQNMNDNTYRLYVRQRNI